MEYTCVLSWHTHDGLCAKGSSSPYARLCRQGVE